MLEHENFVVDSTAFGEDGLEIGKLYDYDLIVLDLMLPDIDGYEVLRRLRAARVSTPALILSGLDESYYKVKGLGCGADDYLTKPFNKSEFVARIRAIIRRSRGHSQSIIRTGNMMVNLDAHSVEVKGQTVPLTGMQYKLVELLSLRKGRLVTRETIMDHLYGSIDMPCHKIIDAFLHRIRTKLSAFGVDKNHIETIRGCGFMLRDRDCPSTIGELAPCEGLATSL